MSKGIYVHIPFCKRKCFYCDFVSYCGITQDVINTYIDTLKFEARIVAEAKGTFPAGDCLQTLYIGGGTPSVLSPEQFEKVLSALDVFAGKTAEFTVECNPESITAEKLHSMKMAGVNRLSFGVQSFSDDNLKFLGRLHSSSTAVEKYFLARDSGFQNINIDLIYGIPGQAFRSPATAKQSCNSRAAGQDIRLWKKTLKETISLAPEHISIYPLAIEEGTALFEKGINTDGDIQSDMFYLASDILETAGYGRYEISNFALPGKECLHNLNYWLCGEYIGLGVSAVSYINGVRSKNTSSIEEYTGSVKSGKRPAVEIDKLDGIERSAERIMLGLRTAAGVRLMPGDEIFIEKLSESRSQGLVESLPGGVLKLTKKGIYLSNAVFRELI